MCARIYTPRQEGHFITPGRKSAVVMALLWDVLSSAPPEEDRMPHDSGCAAAAASAAYSRVFPLGAFFNTGMRAQAAANALF